MATFFDRLGYNFNPIDGANTIIEFSDASKASMNLVPPLLPEWAYDDITNNTVNGYVGNPVAGVTSNIILECIAIANSANSDINTLGEIMNISFECANNAYDFYDHTQRLSGVVEINTDTALLPHYDTGIAVGKNITFLTTQADGVSNSATILGSFTSILVEEELNIILDTISEYQNVISISIEDDGMGNVVSNLSNVMIDTIISDISNVSSYLVERRQHDENFFTQSKNIVEEYQNLKRYTMMGETETFLVNNFLATDKLKTRLA